MRGRLIYIKGHAGSESQKEKAMLSFKEHGWDIEAIEGFTPDTKPLLKVMPKARFHNWENSRKDIKLACVSNHVAFYEEVVRSNEDQLFLEHDALATSPMPEISWNDCIILNIEAAIRNFPGHASVKLWQIPGIGVKALTKDYPLKHYIEGSPYKDSLMIPGTCAYGITVQGAQKMLNAIEKNGVDQSDFQLNSYNLTLEYLMPSPINMQPNLKTSHGLK